MFDQYIYTTILNAAYNILQKNGQRYGREFCERFMVDHDLSNGMSVQRNAERLYGYVVQQSQRMNGNSSLRDDQLFAIVGSYIDEIYRIWAQQNRGMGNFGGRPSGMNFGGSSMGGGSSLFSNNGGGLFGQNQSAGPGSHLMDDHTESQRPQPQAQPAQNLTFANIAAPQENSLMVNFSHNPLDDIPDNGVDFSEVDEPVTWGMGQPKDTSIVMMGRKTLKTGDHKFTINICDGFERVYYSDVMDVVKDFFRVVPDYFLAEPFIFRVFYNHVEELDIPTLEFVDIRDKFIAALSRESHISPYNALISIIDQMLHGPRKALATYLVNRINRNLHLSCGMESNPQLRIRFSQIEDLQELLGTSFESKLLEVPNARIAIANIVNTAILNAVTGCSDIMFGDDNNMWIDVLKNSPVFPHSIPGVYPNKALIPNSGSEGVSKFLDAMLENQLDHKTYIRSLRSVIFTNTLGQKTLPLIGEKPTVCNGLVPSLFNMFTLNHQMKVPTNRSVCEDFDETRQKGSKASAAQEYACYLEDPKKYAEKELSMFVDKDSPDLPVDQTIICMQFKKSPMEYLAALDLFTTMDAPRARGYALFAKKNLPVLKLTV